MEAVKQRLVSLELGEIASHEGLAMVPLLGLSEKHDYLLLEEALDSGCAQVSEVSTAGDVNQLRFSNKWSVRYCSWTERKSGGPNRIG